MNMDEKRLQMIFTFVQILVAEVCVFIFAVVVILAMAGFLAGKTWYNRFNEVCYYLFVDRRNAST